MNAYEKKTKTAFEIIAKEPINIEVISGVTYAFGSELACLRLGNSFCNKVADQTAKVGYSTNIGSWYFRLETK